MKPRLYSFIVLLAAAAKAPGAAGDDGAVDAAVADALLEGELETVGRELGNVFEYAVRLPEVEKLKQMMRRFDTLGCQMTGSGSAVFGLFGDKAEARRCAQALRDLCRKTMICRPCPTGPYEEKKILENLF